MSEQPVDQPWYAVRCVIRFATIADGSAVYEERITLWRADSFKGAIERAEIEVREYVEGIDGEYVGHAQGFHLFVEGDVDDGAEIFSLMRRSDLPPDDYIDRFFDTGDELQGQVE